MDCPVCQVPMVVIEFNGIELDYCVECMGVWFDKGEITVLMDKLGVFKDQDKELHLMVPTDVVTEAKRRCPICNKLMIKVTPSGGENIILDKCPDEDGIWFDAGELRETFSKIWGSSMPRKNLEQALKSFLGELFSTRFEAK